MLLDIAAALLLAVAPIDSMRPVADAPVARRVVETWVADTASSEIAFRVRQFVSRVRGTFKQWTGTVTVDPADWSTAQVHFEITTSSVDTGIEKRDNHLRTPAFFAADSFPTITFRSTKVTRRGADGVTLHGMLTLRGVTRPVTFEGTLIGFQKDEHGQRRAGFEAKGMIDRTAFGVLYNKVVEGAQMLSDEVEIEVALELVRQDPAGAH